MDEIDVQKQMVAHIEYVANELQQIVTLFSEDKQNTAMMRLGILFQNVTNSNKSLEPYREKPAEEPTIIEEEEVKV